MLSIIFLLKSKEDLIIKELLINEQIREKEVRLLDNEGNQLGIKSLKEALDIANNEYNLDLALISPTAVPPVCKIMNYSKFKYDTMKKEKENKKNQKVVKVKEIQLSVSIDVGDLNTRAKQAEKFIREGDKVKVRIQLRGRQNMRPELGMKNMDKFIDMLQEVAQVESKPVLTGREISMTLVPINRK